VENYNISETFFCKTVGLAPVPFYRLVKKRQFRFLFVCLAPIISWTIAYQNFPKPTNKFIFLFNCGGGIAGAMLLGNFQKKEFMILVVELETIWAEIHQVEISIPNIR
jgi:hypothetical protein